MLFPFQKQFQINSSIKNNTHIQAGTTITSIIIIYLITSWAEVSLWEIIKLKHWKTKRRQITNLFICWPLMFQLGCFYSRAHLRNAQDNCDCKDNINQNFTDCINVPESARKEELIFQFSKSYLKICTTAASVKIPLCYLRNSVRRSGSDRKQLFLLEVYSE